MAASSLGRRGFDRDSSFAGAELQDPPPPRPVPPPPFYQRPRYIGLAVAGLLGVAAVFGSYYTISPQEIGVVTRWGAIIHDHQTQGLHFKVPFIDTVHYMPTAVRELKVVSAPGHEINTYTVDNQEVDVSFNVFYRIPADKVAYVLANIPDYEQRLRVVAVDRTKAIMGTINIQQLAEHRGKVRDDIKDLVKKDAAWFGLEVTDFSLTDLTYDKAFRAAVAQAAVQKANIESNEYQRQQAEKTAQMVEVKAKGEANAAREAARGQADARLLNAEAEAKAIQLEGLARAAAIKAQSDALKASPEMVSYTQATRWNGALPSSIYAGAPIPFMDVGRK